MSKDIKKHLTTIQELTEIVLKEKSRLDFLELLLKTGVTVGFKPGFKALVGNVYIEGATSLRDLIDKLIRINNEEEPVPNANTSQSTEEKNPNNP